MKKTIIIMITILCIYLIYKCFDNKKINYVSISDHSIIHANNYNDFVYRYLLDNNRLSSFTKEFINSDISNIYKDLLNNRTIRVNNRDLYFKKVLRESDLVVINVGMTELTKNYDKYDMKYNSALLSKMYTNIRLLVNEIKKYSFGTIIFIGLYNPTNYYDSSVDRLFYDLDIKLNELMIDNNIIYINMYESVKSKKDIDKRITSIIEFYIK